jgi:ubiquinone/menaquinone biosynthesis C-methylase UbiE
MFRERKIPMSEKWLYGLKKDLEESYLRYKEPWKQAGFLLDEQAWKECRKPIADCVEKSGTFLDIDCTNGYLLESIVEWTGDRGLTVTPYGLDISEKLLVLAKERLAKYSKNLFVGSAPYWVSPVKFDYVRTELGYVLEESQEKYLHQIFNSYLAQDGKLLLTEYRSKKQSPKEPWMDEKVKKWDFYIAGRASGFYEGKELTRVLVLTR